MPLGQYVSGALFLAVTLAGSLGAAWLVVSRRLAHQRALPRLLAFAVLATAALTYAEVIPAAMGILSRVSAAAMAVVWLGAAAFVRPAPAEPREPPPAVAPSSRASALAAFVAVGAVVVVELARLRGLATQPLTDIDMLGFHLPGVARFIQTGTLWRVDQFLPGFATAQYPNNGEFLMVAFVVPWHDLAFVRFLPLPYLLLTIAGTYALGVELGASRAAAATMAAGAAALPAFTLLAVQGLPDAAAVALFAVGLVFGRRYLRTRRRSEFILCGLALGLGLGTKWYDATATAVVLVLWVLFSLRAQRARLGRDLLTVLVMIALGGGLWLLRNLILSGNPIYPKRVALLGWQLFGGSQGDVIDRYGYTIAHYLTHPTTLRVYVLPGFEQRVGIMGLVLVVGVIVAAIWAATARRRGVTGAALLGGGVLAVAGILAEYAITPGSAYGLPGEPVQALVNIRWLMPGFVLAAALSARAARTLGRWGILLELAGLAGTLQALGLVGGVPLGTALVLGAVALALVASILAWRVRGRRLPRRLRAPGLAGAAIALLVILLVVGRVDETRFDRHGYGSYDPVFAWIDRHAPSAQRVGITGVWDTLGLPPTLPAFGPRLGNHVAYVGQPVRASLHLPPSRAAFASELRRGRYRLLVVGRQLPGGTLAWAQSLGYRPLAVSPRLELLGKPSSR